MSATIENVRGRRVASKGVNRPGRLLGAGLLVAAAAALALFSDAAITLEAQLVAAVLGAFTTGSTSSVGHLIWTGVGTDAVHGFLITPVCTSLVLIGPILVFTGVLVLLGRKRADWTLLGERESIATEACPPGRVRGYLGAHERQSLYGVFTLPWLPSEQQWRDGARWVRCDLVTVVDEAGAFDPLVRTASLAGAAADAARADALTRCYAVDGAIADPLLSAPEETLDVRCDQPHEYRDVNHWLRQEAAPTAGLAIRECAASVQEWIGLGLGASSGVAGVLRQEANGNLTLRCVSVGTDDAD
jgi:hypothetical protein